jgi:TonB family protein
VFHNSIATLILVLSASCPAAVISTPLISQQATTTIYEDRDLGVRLYEQGDFDNAIKALRAGVKKYKDDAEAWRYLGLSLAGKENWKEARKAFEKAVAFNPSSATSHANLAHTLLFSKALKDARKEAERALSLDADSPEAHYVLGVIHLNQGACIQALTQANAALLGHPGFSGGYLLKSQSLICDIAEKSLRPVIFDGTVFKTSSPAESYKLTDEDKLVKAKDTALRFKEAAANLEAFLKLSPTGPESIMWKEQLETLRFYSEPADTSQVGRTVFSPSEVTTRVRVLSKPEPSYTEKARSALVEGTVVLRAIFAADGMVKNILVLNALPGGLTGRAIDAARQIRFEPATKDGRPVSTLQTIEYNFNLY